MQASPAAQVVPIKCQFGQFFRRFNWSLAQPFDNLKSTLAAVCNVKPGSLHLMYLDDEGDFVRFDSAMELEEAVRLFRNSPDMTALRLKAEPVQENKSSQVNNNNKKKAPARKWNCAQRARHTHIICDLCERSNFVGVRYKCVECADFDLCEECERKDLPRIGSHTSAHAMLKLPVPNKFASLSVQSDEGQALLSHTVAPGAVCPFQQPPQVQEEEQQQQSEAQAQMQTPQPSKPVKQAEKRDCSSQTPPKAPLVSEGMQACAQQNDVGVQKNLPSWRTKPKKFGSSNNKQSQRSIVSSNGEGEQEGEVSSPSVRAGKVTDKLLGVVNGLTPPVSLSVSSQPSDSGRSELSSRLSERSDSIVSGSVGSTPSVSSVSSVVSDEQDQGEFGDFDNCEQEEDEQIPQEQEQEHNQGQEQGEAQQEEPANPSPRVSVESGEGAGDNWTVLDLPQGSEKQDAKPEHASPASFPNSKPVAHGEEEDDDDKKDQEDEEGGELWKSCHSLPPEQLNQVDTWHKMADQLKAMGFNDEDANLQLLIDNNGDMERVVNHLLNQAM